MLKLILGVNEKMRDIMLSVSLDDFADWLRTSWKPLGLSCISKSTLGFPIFQYGFRLYLHPHIEGSGTSQMGISPISYSFRIVVAPSFTLKAWHRIVIVFVKIIYAI